MATETPGVAPFDPYYASYNWTGAPADFSLATNGVGGDSRLENLNKWFQSGDSAYIIVASAMVLVMVPGLGFLYSGLARRKSALSIMWACMAAGTIINFQWYFWGYSLTFSPTGTSGFIGDLQHFGLKKVLGQPSPGSPLVSALLYSFYQMQFCAVTAAIVAGAVAERGRLMPFLVWTFLWATLVYNPIACWAWNVNGWGYKYGVMDYAGGGPVEIGSGLSALAYSMVLGKRQEKMMLNFRPHNVSFILLGTVFLWFGWLGFNGGSSFGANLRAVMACWNSNLTATMAAVAWVLLDFRLAKKWSMVGYLDTWGSVVLGVVTGVVCNFATKIKYWIHIDDSMDVFAEHGIAGMVGLMFNALFGVDYIVGLDGVNTGGINPETNSGIGGWPIGNYRQFYIQLAYILACTGYSFVMSAILAYIVNYIPGLHLRASEEAELLGMDDDQLGEFAYDYVEVRRDYLAWTPAKAESGGVDSDLLADQRYGTQEHQTMFKEGTSSNSSETQPRQAPGDGTDFDLKIYKDNSDEEYTDDTEIIPKDSTVLARRLPASAPGKGRAARYVSGKPPVSAKASAAASTVRKNVLANMDNMTEQERLQAMFKLQDAQWQQTQENMSHETRVPLQGGKPMKRGNIPEGEPPHGYICYRCGKKGHWIQACPTNDDANYDNKNRIKRTTGIPRSMLKKIDQADIDKLDDEQRQHLMVNAEGEYVFAQADEKAWKRHLEQVEASKKAAQKVQTGDKELQERGLECAIDKRLFVDPMKTPCCGKTYCHDCIENALLDNDLTCPGCLTENISLEGLIPDEEVKQKIKDYQDEKANEKQRSQSPAVNGESDTVSRDVSKSPTSATATSKKRTADEASASYSLAGPYMKRQKSNEGSAVATPQPVPDDQPNTPGDDSVSKQGDVTENETTEPEANNMQFDPSMMPPDFSQMQAMMNQMNGMGMMNPMMMNNPMMMQQMMMNMTMNPMMMGMMGNSMPGMNGMNGLNNGNHGFHHTYDQGHGHNRGAWQVRGRGGARGGWQGHQNHQQVQEPKQPEGLSNVPTGPKALQQAGGNQNQGIYPTTGHNGGGKFNYSNPRYAGKEEDNAYMRQPVNPHRQWARSRGRGRMREAEYRELGQQH
ncbi:hypothetical protein DV736_g4746, partial [Chaetothyriales sp. CBS 134916]